jgi:hypothetical protein
MNRMGRMIAIAFAALALTTAGAATASAGTVRPACAACVGGVPGR